MGQAWQGACQRQNNHVAGKFRTLIEVPLPGRSLLVNVWPVSRSQAQPPRWQFWRHRWTLAFWNRAYKENITGLSGMVAYNLMLAVFPFALLVLFIFGKVVNSPDVEHSVILDIQRLFPNIEQATLQDAIDRVRASSTTIGIAAIVGGIWIGASWSSCLNRLTGANRRNRVRKKMTQVPLLPPVHTPLLWSLVCGRRLRRRERRDWRGRREKSSEWPGGVGGGPASNWMSSLLKRIGLLVWLQRV